jgi:hypothetical protein
VKYTRVIAEYDSLLLARSIGWATRVSSQHTTLDHSRTTIVKACLGVHHCPYPKCAFAKRPPVPSSYQPPLSQVTEAITQSTSSNPDDSLCSIHQLPLALKECSVTCRLVEANGRIELTNFGSHYHHKPLPVRASMEAVLALQTVYNAAPAVRPKTLQIGTATQDSVAAKFTVYHNLDYL